MKRTVLCLIFLGVLAGSAAGQSSDVKFIADNLVIQAEGTLEADSGAG